MNKTTVIKKTIGSVIKEHGFEFLRREYKIIWIFNRVINDVEERVIIQQHKEDDSEYKIMLSTSAMGNGRKEIGDIMPEYEGKEYWPAETDKEFEDVMAFFAEFLKDKGMEILDDMLTEKPDSFETPERKAWFKEHRSELVAKYEDRYHILANGSRYEQFIHIDEILYENRASGEDKESVEKVYDLILGMAAILCEIILKEDGAYVSYDTYYVEAYNPVLDRIWTCWPIHIVSQAWIRYHDGEELKRLYVWGRLTSYIRDSTVYMEKGEFVDYVERLMTKEGITPDLYNDEESGADFIIINPNCRILIKCVYTDKMVDTRVIKREFSDLNALDTDRIILVLNNEIADPAIRHAIMNKKNETNVVTCWKTYTLKYVIKRFSSR